MALCVYMSLAAHLHLQANHKSWMSDSFDKLDGEAVEKDVTTAHKVLYKMGKVFATRRLDQMAANAESLRQEVEEFKTLVPLVQVCCQPITCCTHICSAEGCIQHTLLANTVFASWAIWPFACTNFTCQQYLAADQVMVTKAQWQ